MTEHREHWLKYKKDDPFGMKTRFIRDFIFRDFKSYANSQLNCCGWLFEEGSYNHKLWRLYRCDLEEIERLHGYRMKVYQEKYGRDFYPTQELRQIFLIYLHDAYEVYKRTLTLHQPMKLSQCKFYLSWFEKNIRKFEKISQ